MYVLRSHAPRSCVTLDLSRLSLFWSSDSVDGRNEEQHHRKDFLEDRHDDLRCG